MNSLQLISDYKENEIYKKSFIGLAKQVFHIDFTKWDKLGCWNDDYICYSYLDGDKVVANVSINKMNVIIQHKEYKALQLGTVMTHPDYRNKGLAVKLINHVLGKYIKEYDFIYLFANPSVLDFYPKFGFERIQETRLVMSLSNFPIQQENISIIRKLDVDKSDDFLLMKRFAENRIPVSTICGVKRNKYLLFFYLIEAFNEMTYYLEKEDAIILYEKIDDELHLYDVISTSEIDIEALLSVIVTDETKRVVFHFIPDVLNNKSVCTLVESEDVLFMRPAKMNETIQPILFPLTSHA
ncbi:GNAT family N-acetyltransferase [Niallia sp.]|uniref:GNAT family N-acetyltransferase n=1 Tax=Niallia sp. TaxID=2837523 RepID=UPI002899C3F6|nr:GNAT family N-acetyltransferase [Niallia sp.]